MPQRSLWRETVLLSLPVVAIGGLFGWSQWQKRFRTPTIALSVQFDTKHLPSANPFGFSPDEKLSFSWDANLKGGPQSGYRFGWNESIVAKTPRGSIVVWTQNVPPKAWQLDAVGGSFITPSVSGTFSSAQSLNRTTHSRLYQVDGTTLPLDTQKLEWRGEIVAIPSNDADIWQSPLPHEALSSWSQMAGAAKWQRTIALPYNAHISGAVLIRSQKSVQPHPNSKQEVSIEILSRRENRRVFRRLVAFDGKTKRVLWTDVDRFNIFCRSIGNGGYSSREGESLSFDVGRIPAAWGEVTFLCDTVFDINKRARVIPLDDAKLNEQELATFERKTAGYRVSRRLVLRPQ